MNSLWRDCSALLLTRALWVLYFLLMHHILTVLSDSVEYKHLHCPILSVLRTVHVVLYFFVLVCLSPINVVLFPLYVIGPLEFLLHGQLSWQPHSVCETWGSEESGVSTYHPQVSKTTHRNTPEHTLTQQIITLRLWQLTLNMSKKKHAQFQIKLYLSHAPNTTGVVDLAVKCLLTNPNQQCSFKKNKS